MSLPVSLVAHGLLGASAASLTAWWYPKVFRPPAATNYRGHRVPVSLGVGLMAGLLPSLAGAMPAIVEDRAGFAWWAYGALMLVFAAGMYDDRRPVRERGVVAQIGALRHGKVAPGVVKLLAIAAAAVVVVLASGASAPRSALGVLVIAGAANSVNLLDVLPGRALKVGILSIAGLLVARATGLLASALGATLVLLPLDLRERAMLGDSGANVLGFVVGMGLFLELSVPGLWVALTGILVIHVVSETVTLSRMIRGVAPLRWFDDLGRVRDEGPEGVGIEGMGKDS